jgi:hypothetical protein
LYEAVTFLEMSGFDEMYESWFKARERERYIFHGLLVLTQLFKLELDLSL